MRKTINNSLDTRLRGYDDPSYLFKPNNIRSSIQSDCINETAMKMGNKK